MHSFLFISIISTLYTCFHGVQCQAVFDATRDEDLHSFVTVIPLLLLNGAPMDDGLLTSVQMPNIRAIKFNVTHHHPDLVSPGYWFVAPYWYFEADAPDGKYMPCQVGPHIYDGNGTLIWAGSCLHHNRNIFDFRANHRWDDQSIRLSFIMQHSYVNDGSPLSKGAAYILNDRYEVEAEVPVTNDLERFDLHEFNILEGGHTALAATQRIRNMPLTELGRPTESSRVASGGFVEIDLATGAVLFDWDSRGRIPLHESDHVMPWSPPEGGGGMDYIHVNAADKSANGDYLMSARYTSTIYLISGHDGQILWRLGGKYSDFAMDFTFSKQHNAQFVSVNETHTVLSFLNNAADDFTNQENVSSAMVVLLDTVHRTATVLQRYPRPDGGLSRMRGNFQLLDTGNRFVGWSEQGYHSEHAPDGTVVMEAKFVSPRFNSYRSYKFPFRGHPQQPPALVASVYGSGGHPSEYTTVLHVSWNGATEVAHWSFYAQEDDTAPMVPIGNVTKRDFETVFVARGFRDWLSAEALDRNGRSLGWSEITRSKMQGELRYGSPEPVETVLEPNETVVIQAPTASPISQTANHPPPQTRARGINSVVVGAILLAGVGAILVIWVVKRMPRKRYRYSRLASPGGDIPMDNERGN
ncbi:hypothetical protein BO78DRAFT_393478 [Aspergillus sclerotiicarbonarius CBS 121057]|uniref:Arylsulfotransferase n=1 Tax=Aspergillus sclerotiicarbonarius (strain CBS 121057 / IBT 28362) TaxID=1448318 RepID=A0A319ETY2_ASPSB|nr:hypothetical protein BO78DRAFT_393478 [Aspergillus sclerotiicarbonarius CBS 121057]